MRKVPFDEKIKTIMGNNLDVDIPRGSCRGKQYNHVCNDLSANFIDGQVLDYRNIKGNLCNTEIKYHTLAKHLNSSQVMCISFFKKFFETEKSEQILLDSLSQCGVRIEPEASIENAIFEFVQCDKERTNFDFYMSLSDGNRLFFEIKYTEKEFGSVSKDKKYPDRYVRTWNEIHRQLVSECPFLNCSHEEFYSTYLYQINRNIVNAKANDQVIFLTPRANDAKGIVKGRDYIDRIHREYPEIMNLYWEDIYKAVHDRIDDEDFKKYYVKFGEKYIDILDQQ